MTGQGAGEGYNINVHLDCGATDTDMITPCDEQLLPRAEEFKPDFILISAGFDSRQADTLGCFDVTDEAFATITRKLMALADKHCNGRIVSALEGGYNVDGLAGAVTNHVAALLGKDTPLRTYADRSRSIRTDTPSVKGGILHLPAALVPHVTRAVIRNAAGAKVGEVRGARARRAHIDLRGHGLASGRYAVTVESAGSAPVTVPFQACR
jgi:hypothetical protein